jgi:hypothetical protein
VLAPVCCCCCLILHRWRCWIGLLLGARWHGVRRGGDGHSPRTARAAGGGRR